MATHFVTFLGRAPVGDDGRLEDEPRRRYRFPDDACSEPTRLFARAALARLDAGRRRPDHVLVLGTAGSMWDALLTELAEGVEAPDLWTAVNERAAVHAVTAADVAQVTATLAPLLGRPVAGHVVPAGTTEADQLAVLGALAEHCRPGDRLVLDLTHRYRHLPLAGLVSASLLAYDRECELLDVWYADHHGADGDPPACPVVSLRPLLAVQEWGRAFAVLRESGRFEAMAGVLGDHPAAEPLRETGFFLATNQVGEARHAGRAAINALQRDGRGNPLLEVIADDVLASLDWVDEPRVWDRMLDVARRALAAGDHLEAVTLTQEALYWAAAGAFWGADKPKESDSLEALKRRILGSMRGRRADIDRFHLLRKLRNAVAHGLKPSGRGAREVASVLAAPGRYTRTLRQLIDWVDGWADRWRDARREVED